MVSLDAFSPSGTLCRMTTSIEGRIDGRVGFRYDFVADVLHLRVLAHTHTAAAGHTTAEGDVRWVDEATGREVGRTIVRGWERTNRPSPPDSRAALAAWAESAAVGL